MKKMNLVKLMAVAFVVLGIASSAYATEAKDLNKDAKKAKHELKHKKHVAEQAAGQAVKKS